MLATSLCVLEGKEFGSRVRMCGVCLCVSTCVHVSVGWWMVGWDGGNPEDETGRREELTQLEGADWVLWFSL